MKTDSSKDLKPMDLHTELSWRGLVQQMTAPTLGETLAKNSTTVYCGFDPTADSFHVGSLLQILNLRRFQEQGHRPIFLVGGATGMVGDPSGKSQERLLLGENDLEKNIRGLTKQLDKFVDTSGKNGAIIANNNDWFSSMGFLRFLRDIGKHFTVNMMLGKESVRSRLEDREHGISYTEFSYMLLQAYDFLELFDRYECRVQIGGSDQWGNIVAGTDLIRRLRQKEAFGLTFPLVTRADGTKFGKSEKGNVWLDPERTSAYEFYQFFMQTSDDDVIKLLKYYTWLAEEDILELGRETLKNPEKREGQKILARELTKLVHGEAELIKVETTTAALFAGGDDITKLSKEGLNSAFIDAPQSSVSRQEILGPLGDLIELLVHCGLCASKGAARKDITGGGIYVNQERIDKTDFKINEKNLLHGSTIVLRKGKKTYHIVKIS